MDTIADAAREYQETADRYLLHCMTLVHKLNQSIHPGEFYKRQKIEPDIIDNAAKQKPVFLDMLEEELPNLLIAMGKAQHLSDSAYICKLADELSTFLNQRSHWSEWLAIAELAGNEAKIVSDPKIGSVAFNGLAVVYRQLERFEEAEEYCQQSLSLCQQVGDQYGEGLAYGNLAGIHFEQGRLQASQREYEEAHSIFHQLGDLYEQSQALLGIGITFTRSKKLDKANSKFNECLNIQRKIGDKFGEAQALNNLGIALRMQGKMDQAIQSLLTSIRFKRELGDRQGIATALNNLAISYRQQNDLDRAITAWNEALEIYSEINSPEMERIALRLAKAKKELRSSESK